ncbi:MAG: winged helix-turn-helix transcriptional regulator [Candidatus Thorarchaeota archaeon]
MRQVIKRAAFAITMVLMMSGLVSLFLINFGGSGTSLALHDLSVSSDYEPVTLDLQSLVAPMTMGTSVLFSSGSFISITSSAFFALALGTVVIDRRSEEQQPRLRDRVLDGIASNPGIHLRELQRVIGCAMGALQYHMKSLESDRSVISTRIGNSKHFFLSDFSQNEDILTLTALSRNPTISSILVEIIAKGQVTQAELSRVLSLDKSLISYYISSLLKADVLNIVRVFGRERPVILAEWASSAILDLALV